MTVTVQGIIKNAGEEELNGSIRVTAQKNFTDSGGEFHITSIPFIDEVIDGSFSIQLPATIRYTYTTATLTDSNNIVKFTSLIEGEEGNLITVTIEDGTSLGSKITINEGQTNEEVYDDVDMDETVPASYIIDVINGSSSLVSVERLSDLTDDTLPANQTSTTLSGGSTTNLIKYSGTNPVYYTFEFLNQYNQVFKMLSKIELPYSVDPIDISDLM